MAIILSRRRTLLGGMSALVPLPFMAGCAAFEPDGPQTPLRPDHALRVATYNIRYLDLTQSGVDHPRGPDAWQERRPLVLAALQQIDADLIAFQEMESWTGEPQGHPPIQREWLTQQMPEYGSAAATCSLRAETGQPVFFRRARLTLLEEGCAQLPETPGISGAFAGYADRITWARFRDRMTGRRMTVINLHLHFTDRLRRLTGADKAQELVNEATQRGDAVIVLGDFNELAGSGSVRHLNRAGLTLVPSTGSSFHFNAGLNLFPAIDHILHADGIAAIGPATVLRVRQGDLWPSDHHPVWVDLVNDG
ncbi:endonuclease/exonuclease/phosphatase family protein [Nioella aestuarii]|uniref:endonuclease/exonuclease/phosphatase family protein n=1 Tax=Nioella aestuarii TaxID=1662864 RepID=UPI003D7FD0B2